MSGVLTALAQLISTDALPVLMREEREWVYQLITEGEDNKRPSLEFDRIWRQIPGNMRLCLHVLQEAPLDRCAFWHSHQNPTAVAILSGTYEISFSDAVRQRDPRDNKAVGRIIMHAPALYAMTDPNGWHAIRPHTEVVSVMIVHHGPEYNSDETLRGPELDISNSGSRVELAQNIRRLVWRRMRAALRRRPEASSGS